MKKSISEPSVQKTDLLSEIRLQLRIGNLCLEKCELRESREAFLRAWELSRTTHAVKESLNALVGLLRLALEALDEKGLDHWEKEVEKVLEESTGKTPALAWFCRGSIATRREDWKKAQRFYLRFLQAVRREKGPEWNRDMARGLALVANAACQQGKISRAIRISEEILRRWESQKLKEINGTVYLILGKCALRNRDYREALRCFRAAHAAFLEEHNWYYHLYALYGYARVSRLQQHYSQAYWYLDLIEKAASGPEFGSLKREVSRERHRLEDDAVDLVVDGARGQIRIRDGGKISLRKQYVLMDILRALSKAHNHPGDESERGLSKAEIIEQVWKERYRPEAHDNKLYYNINRLRKLIEPDVKKPRYLLNWKEGYRLAPGLRVQFTDSVQGGSKGIQVKGSELKQ